MTPDYFAHESAVIDAGCTIGAGTRIWHFSHIMSGAVIGEACNLGQNVVVSPGVVLGRNVKVQNNVSIYEGVTCEDDVFLGPSCVFTNITNPRSAVIRKGMYASTGWAGERPSGQMRPSCAGTTSGPMPSSEPGRSSRKTYLPTHWSSGIPPAKSAG